VVLLVPLSATDPWQAVGENIPRSGETAPRATAYQSDRVESHGLRSPIPRNHISLWEDVRWGGTSTPLECSEVRTTEFCEVRRESMAPPRLITASLRVSTTYKMHKNTQKAPRKSAQTTKHQMKIFMITIRFPSAESCYGFQMPMPQSQLRARHRA
jgi:hypothetical protein